jgi:hypothetical protein
VKRFPSERLVPVTGRIGALLFENPNANVARDVYWSISIDFAPLTVDDEELECSASCEWLRLGIRDWRALEGKVVEGGDEVEASFYTFEHDPASRTRIEVSDREGETFRVRLSMEVDDPGGDFDPRLLVTADLRVPFEGLDVYFDIVPPSVGRAGDALRVATPFVDVTTLDEPRIHTNEFGVSAYRLRPRS